MVFVVVVCTHIYMKSIFLNENLWYSIFFSHKTLQFFFIQMQVSWSNIILISVLFSPYNHSSQCISSTPQIVFSFLPRKFSHVVGICNFLFLCSLFSILFSSAVSQISLLPEQSKQNESQILKFYETYRSDFAERK